MASDRLEQAVLEKEQAELEIQELRLGVSDQKRHLYELEQRIGEIEAASVQERERLGAELELHCREQSDLEEQCIQLREEIERLEAELEAAEQDRDDAQSRCEELEMQLVEVQEEAEREALQAQAREERLRMARATGVAEQHLEDLERVRREADQVRLAAAREAATKREEAEAQARAIIEEAKSTVRIRPSVLSRSSALRQLRDATSEIAYGDLPTAFTRLTRMPPHEDLDISVKSVGLQTQDDIGKVARAFDRAVRLAWEQALEQRSLMKIFVNLSRRSQDLLQRQLTLLSKLEEQESDPGQLSNYFKLDHLATRMRRTGENFLALAGADQDPGRRWHRPVPMVDILRAAAAEVEQYERIELISVAATEVKPSGINDLVHLLAELLENATKFSAPQTTVRVTSFALPDGRVLIKIHDNGIGLAPQDLAELNERLIDPPPWADTSSRHTGIIMAGFYSGRQSIRVHLSPAESGGTTAAIMLPPDLTHWSTPAAK
ncbi:hypothetical protein FCI23_31790 [Actinacidiphila oryziradicis]|uniref:histidine kinase n=2 Tax=Actinacidiphila oryziradicis TaxID=2571141 RepID=A0A4U0SCA2_9ACTN|nr:hypothetical protein FCI23_31790 [Actinacidiphila oryziradicis]